MIPRELWKWSASSTAATEALTLWAGEAVAFFPPLPIASDNPPTIIAPPTTSPILINPITEQPIIVNPINPLPIPPLPPPNVPQVVPPTVPPCHCVCPNDPQVVPEPATWLAGGIGLGLLAVRSRWRRSFRIHSR